MAFLYITEFARCVRDSDGKEVAAPDYDSLTAAYRVAIGGTSVQGPVLNSRTRFVKLATDVICSIAYGSNPTAVATIDRLAANESQFVGAVAPNMFAVITNT